MSIVALAIVAALPLIIRGGSDFLQRLRTSEEVLENFPRRKVMREDLERLAKLQSAHLGTTDQYSSDFAKLGFVASNGVTIVLAAYANAAGWTALAMHSDLDPLDRCAMWDGVLDDSNTRLLPGNEPVTRRTVECTWDP